MEDKKVEFIEDIKGADHLAPDWGERFKGWYRYRTFNRSESVLIQNDITYKFKVCDYKFQFIMPSMLEFSRSGLGVNGEILYNIISYSEAERLLGIFRFPKNMDGTFSSPFSVQDIQKELLNLTEDQIKELINKKEVLTFEAFKIPFLGFQYFFITEYEFSEVEKVVSDEISSLFKSTYEKELNSRIEEVKSKIQALPNFLLILQNTLDLQLTKGSEISFMTDGILHFGI